MMSITIFTMGSAVRINTTTQSIVLRTGACSCSTAV